MYKREREKVEKKGILFSCRVSGGGVFSLLGRGGNREGRLGFGFEEAGKRDGVPNVEVGYIVT